MLKLPVGLDRWSRADGLDQNDMACRSSWSVMSGLTPQNGSGSSLPVPRGHEAAGRPNRRPRGRQHRKRSAELDGRHVEHGRQQQYQPRRATKKAARRRHRATAPITLRHPSRTALDVHLRAPTRFMDAKFLTARVERQGGRGNDEGGGNRRTDQRPDAADHVDRRTAPRTALRGTVAASATPPCRAAAWRGDQRRRSRPAGCSRLGDAGGGCRRAPSTAAASRRTSA